MVENVRVRGCVRVPLMSSPTLGHAGRWIDMRSMFFMTSCELCSRARRPSSFTDLHAPSESAVPSHLLSTLAFGLNYALHATADLHQRIWEQQPHVLVSAWPVNGRSVLPSVCNVCYSSMWYYTFSTQSYLLLSNLNSSLSPASKEVSPGLGPSAVRAAHFRRL
jgi:hypothetical protein